MERVDGLNVGNYIYYNGVKVGSVNNVELANGDSVRVTLSFDLGVDIPRGSVAQLESSGLLDEKAIVIQKGDSDEYIDHGDTIEGRYVGGFTESFKEEGDQITNDLSSSVKQLNNLLEQLNKTVNDQNSDRIGSTLGNLETSTGEISTLLNRKRSELETSITHANRFMANLDTVSTDNREQIDSVLTGIDTTLKHVDKLSNELNSTTAELNEILQKVNQGEGTLGRMVNDESLYNNTDSVAVEMHRLIKNINDDPNTYLKNLRLIEIF